MQHRVERRAIGVAGHLADRGFDRKTRDPLDQILARLAIGDQLGDRDALEAVLGGEGLDLRPDHHRAVVVGEFADDRRRTLAGKPTQVDRRLGVAGAHQHAAFARDQREDVAGADEVARPHVGIGERAHGVAALLGGNAGRHAVLDVDRDGEGGAERRVVHRHHRRELQAARFVAGQRRANDAAAVADDERHLLGRAQRGGDDHVAFVLAIVVVGDDDDLAARDRLDGLADWIRHVRSPIERARAVEKVVRRHRAARLGDGCAAPSRATPRRRRRGRTASPPRAKRRSAARNRARFTPERTSQSASFMAAS